MDAEDRERTQSNKQKVLAYLKAHGSATNHMIRRIGGSRGMGRVHELQKAGEPITVRKMDKSTWEVRYDAPPLARDAKQRVNQKRLF